MAASAPGAAQATLEEPRAYRWTNSVPFPANPIGGISEHLLLGGQRSRAAVQWVCPLFMAAQRPPYERYGGGDPNMVAWIRVSL